jgi:glucosamine-6-phosphate deaminase
MGAAAAREVAQIIAGAIRTRGEARVVFACAPSQDEFLAALISKDSDLANVDWSCVVAFHMDEYVGISASAAQSFRSYLREHLLDRLPATPTFHPIHGEAASLDEECGRYAQLISERPLDLVCLGIGENGHLAFNDPPVADFDDPAVIKIVDLDLACRQQQVNDGCFPRLDAVPKQALTLTIPTLLSAAHLSCVVPGIRKAAAVRDTLQAPIAPACPATVLRNHPHAVLHLDRDSASLLS